MAKRIAAPMVAMERTPQRKRPAPKLGDRVLFRSMLLKHDELPRAAFISGISDDGRVHLTVLGHPKHDDHVTFMRPDVVLIERAEAEPHRAVREWAWYGEWTLENARDTSEQNGAAMPLAGDGDEDEDEHLEAPPPPRFHDDED